MCIRDSYLLRRLGEPRMQQLLVVGALPIIAGQWDLAGDGIAGVKLDKRAAYLAIPILKAAEYPLAVCGTTLLPVPQQDRQRCGNKSTTLAAGHAERKFAFEFAQLGMLALGVEASVEHLGNKIVFDPDLVAVDQDDVMVLRGEDFRLSEHAGIKYRLGENLVDDAALADRMDKVVNRNQCRASAEHRHERLLGFLRVSCRHDCGSRRSRPDDADKIRSQPLAGSRLRGVKQMRRHEVERVAVHDR